MEHNQSVQSQSLQQKVYGAKLRQNLENQESWDTLKRIYHNYHWLFLFSLLFIFLGSSAIALYSLGYVATGKRKQPETLQVEVVKPISTKNERENRIPMWSVVAIAVSCASGCLIVLRFLNRPNYQPKSKKRVRSHRRQRTLHQNHQRPSKKLQPLLTTTSLQKKKSGYQLVNSPAVMTMIPPKSKLTTIPNQQPVASMVSMPAKNPLPPLLKPRVN
ncbi:hypothetical protein [Calothrix rhizosoleniae]|uniref:hypothetical protein n=1 Tax=Calothrix rhizosoleniae TaxID=888997 RepID=UPI000B4A40E9|nr:hypothetical protein [Calothrix rhizosoleniae]